MRYRFATPEAIYGTILFCAVLAATAHPESDGYLLLRGMVASVAIWVAHVVAVAIASHGSQGTQVSGVRRSLRHALRHSAGILVGPILPILALSLGALNLVDDLAGYIAALAAGIGILMVLGYVALLERRARWYVCAAGALITGVAGFAAITLKALFAE